MLRSIANRVLSGGRRTATPTKRRSTTGGAGGGSANREIEQGAKSLIRGVSRKKRGL